MLNKLGNSGSLNDLDFNKANLNSELKKMLDETIFNTHNNKSKLANIIYKGLNTIKPVSWMSAYFNLDINTQELANKVIAKIE